MEESSHIPENPEGKLGIKEIILRKLGNGKYAGVRI
jgi:hypothetical protein